MAGEFRKCNLHKLPASALQKKVQVRYLHRREKMGGREEMMMMMTRTMMKTTMTVVTNTKKYQR